MDVAAPAATTTRNELTGIPTHGGKGRGAGTPGPTLFDDPPVPTAEATQEASLGAKIVASEVYAAQRKVLSRLPIRDEQIQSLVDALTSAAGARLPRTVVAAALGVAGFRIEGALSQARQLLNVEGYNVVGVDPDGQTIVLDVPLMREQFGVR